MTTSAIFTFIFSSVTFCTFPFNPSIFTKRHTNNCFLSLLLQKSHSISFNIDLKENKIISILLLGLKVLFVLAAILLSRIWRFYIDNTKNKVMHLCYIQGNTAAIPQHVDLEAGEAA